MYKKMTISKYRKMYRNLYNVTNCKYGNYSQ